MREQRLPVLLLSSLSSALPLKPSLKFMLHRGVSVIFKENESFAAMALFHRYRLHNVIMICRD